MSVGKVVDDQIVDHAACFIQHRAVECAARGFQLVDVIGKQAQQESFGLAAAKVGGAHVRYVEHAAILTDGMMFLDLRTVVQRHVPATEVDHAGAQLAVLVVKNCFLRHEDSDPK